MQIVSKNIKFMQDNDCLDSNTDGQWLDVKIEDGGGGAFAIISTNRWAMDEKDIDNFCNTLKEQIKGVGF